MPVHLDPKNFNPDANRDEHVYVNAASPFGQKVAAILAEHPTWRVVNAPRPLAGDVTFDGPFHCGLFFAAGDPAVYDTRGLFTWSSQHAVEVVLVTNDEIRQWMLAHLAANNVPANYLDEAVADMGMASLAGSYGLPWVEVDENGNAKDVKEE